MKITTERLILRPWCADDLAALADMQSDPEVMADYGGPQSLDASRAKLERYQAAFDALGYCRWAVDERGGGFIGYVGVMPVFPGHPRDPGFEVGWRLVRAASGKGYATEAARAALADAFGRVGLAEVLSYTAPDNLRSQAVMGRLGLTRRPELDFEDNGWAGLVWSAAPELFI
ncbi:GNAT family N-acetyltransferase [Phenylobacterium terrae]|uniref:GNAT family N-acetyltransferase n=1 Tax=Phenylobacterium terrae TaxID=2665495 RepID=A0ABW4MX09_9CAUL